MMFRMVLRRIGIGIVTLWVVSLLMFAGTEILPGDVAQIMLGQEATPENLAALREALGLNKPAWVRYFEWLGDMVRFDLGMSLGRHHRLRRRRHHHRRADRGPAAEHAAARGDRRRDLGAALGDPRARRRDVPDEPLRPHRDLLDPVPGRGAGVLRRDPARAHSGGPAQLAAGDRDHARVRVVRPDDAVDGAAGHHAVRGAARPRWRA